MYTCNILYIHTYTIYAYIGPIFRPHRQLCKRLLIGCRNLFENSYNTTTSTTTVNNNSNSNNRSAGASSKSTSSGKRRKQYTSSFIHSSEEYCMYNDCNIFKQTF